ncbi:MAG: TMEM165/GDT1 family protein [Gammaproteobacteria bacterium]|nr:TMEM165/GDT1 family protein [Gammaproteobacteria bacterium]MBT4194929.1 TMEM165/GDT1 family protein [Gammaproteobacteria bacterium]MBT6454429.1 TMEM165/GDT1 family protein [Gammaproteobacteria bacterium]MBT6701936.1 TMEM165/GDT1 family protein [Gammaproteobacteria bacterium]MBT7046134.1 TMEM165/GDT1 family protein [Gammaproteobacteria bacterium]
MSVESLSISMSSFGLISLAEIGDKSLLVCMTPATQHRYWPDILGAMSALIFLNVLAFLFGTSGISLESNRYQLT